MKKKNIVLESYAKLFLEEFDHTRIPREYVEQLADDAIASEFQDGYITIAGYKLDPAKCLKTLDPLAYKEFVDRYCESQNITENDDGTYYDHMEEELNQSHEAEDDLAKECCHCCGQEFLKQELNPQNGYCFACQQDELENGPQEFRILPDDTEAAIIIKESCMKRWKKLHK